MSDHNAKTLFKGLKSQLENDWRRFRNQSHNPSNKGSSYEEGFRSLLSKYFGGIYDFRTEPVVVDSGLQVFDLFDTGRGQHEVDVVALFRQANPRILFDVGEMTYVPLDGVAFICEVKSKIDTGRLEHDLKKMRKLRKLAHDAPRDLGVHASGDYTADNQLLCAIYDENSISDRALSELLDEYNDAWDMVLIVESDDLWINSALPMTKKYSTQNSLNRVTTGDLSKDIRMVTSDFLSIVKNPSKFHQNNALVWFLLTISISIPVPMSVSTISTMEALMQYQSET